MTDDKKRYLDCVEQEGGSTIVKHHVIFVQLSVHFIQMKCEVYFNKTLALAFELKRDTKYD